LRALSKPTDLSELRGDDLLDRVAQAILAYGELAHGYRPQPHHRDMIRFIAEGLMRRKHSQVLEPRGAAKTTWGNTAFLSWLIAMFDIRVGLVSNTDLQALDFSRAIKWTFEQNGEHREIFGDLVNPSKWTNKEWIRKGSRWAGTKDVSLFAVGVGGAIISKRFDVILMDDILDEENTSNPDVRESTKGPFDHFDVLPDGHRYVIKIGVDLASSEKESADFTARVTTARDACRTADSCSQRGEFFVLSAYRDRRESHHSEFVYDGYQAYPDVALVLVESQQFQSTLIHTVMEEHPEIPIEGKKQDVDKVTRARAVAAKYEAHKVHHHRALKGTAFEVELLSFPKGHDDLVDSEGLSFDLASDTFFFGSVRAGNRAA
jgi:predicted phage terminase large subunit-like protein